MAQMNRGLRRHCSEQPEGGIPTPATDRHPACGILVVIKRAVRQAAGSPASRAAGAGCSAELSRRDIGPHPGARPGGRRAHRATAAREPRRRLKSEPGLHRQPVASLTGRATGGQARVDWHDAQPLVVAPTFDGLSRVARSEGAMGSRRSSRLGISSLTVGWIPVAWRRTREGAPRPSGPGAAHTSPRPTPGRVAPRMASLSASTRTFMKPRVALSPSAARPSGGSRWTAWAAMRSARALTARRCQVSRHRPG
jgi:hypothetical protein